MDNENTRYDVERIPKLTLITALITCITAASLAFLAPSLMALLLLAAAGGIFAFCLLMYPKPLLLFAALIPFAFTLFYCGIEAIPSAFLSTLFLPEGFVIARCVSKRRSRAEMMVFAGFFFMLWCAIAVLLLYVTNGSELSKLLSDYIERISDAAAQLSVKLAGEEVYPYATPEGAEQYIRYLSMLMPGMICSVSGIYAFVTSGIYILILRIFSLTELLEERGRLKLSVISAGLFVASYTFYVLFSGTDMSAPELLCENLILILAPALAIVGGVGAYARTRRRSGMTSAVIGAVIMVMLMLLSISSGIMILAFIGVAETIIDHLNMRVSKDDTRSNDDML